MKSPELKDRLEESEKLIQEMTVTWEEKLRKTEEIAQVCASRLKRETSWWCVQCNSNSISGSLIFSFEDGKSNTINKYIDPILHILLYRVTLKDKDIITINCSLCQK